jgi:D-alanyl-lipoteichoic acid acyltransferase DltB (MBOAT superfamily)
MGGNRVKVPSWIFNIIVVFTLSGFWHGANWTFIIWGALYAFVYLIEHFFRKNIKLNFSKNRFISAIFDGFAILKNFVLVTVIWIFFRSINLGQIKQIFASIYHNFNVIDGFHVGKKIWLFLALFILFDVIIRKSRFDTWCGNRSFVVRRVIYTVMLFSIVAFSSVESFPFIYFQF